MTTSPLAPPGSAPELSIVVPVFNAAGRLRALHDALSETLASTRARGEIIYVDDGSRDDSWNTIVAFTSEVPTKVRGCRLARNVGQQAATYCGLLEARGQWIVTIDDDLQPHPREIVKLWDRARCDPHDVIYGVYAVLHHGLVRRVGTRLFRSALRRLAPGFPDGSSFRLIRRDIVQAIPGHLGPWILIDSVLAWYTADFVSMTVEHGPRQSGRSGYSWSSLAAIALTLLFTYSRVPLRLMTIIGLLSALVSFGLGSYYLIQRVTVGAQLGFSALIVTIAFSSGLVLLCLGILGEYLSRIHAMGSGEPAFAVKARAGA